MEKKKYLIDLIKVSFGIPIVKKEDYEIPDSNNLFGIFSSIHRYTENIKNENDSVHGCIGYWNLEGMDKKSIINKGFDVTNSAFWSNSRQSRFNESIKFDPYAKIKIYFMKKPLFKINSENGKFEINNQDFINNEYGIIVEGNGKRATYLPYVFPNKGFNEIKTSIIQKAGINENEESVYYGYLCEIEEIFFYELLNKDECFKKLDNFVNFVNEIYLQHSFILYQINKNNQTHINKNQYVRNIYSIYDYFYFSHIINKLPNKNSNVYLKIKDNVNEYNKIFKEKKDGNMRQAGAFLILLLNEFYNVKRNENINFYKDLLKNNSLLNQNFELPQILIMLTSIQIDYTFLIDYLVKFKERIQNEENIFFYNWVSKLLFEIKRKNILENKNYTLFNDIIYILKEKIIQIITSFNDDTETNYLAVAFEGLSSLYFLKNGEDKEIYKNIFYLYTLLEKNIDKRNLYAFKNKSSRLDITTHVLYGFSSLYILQ